MAIHEDSRRTCGAQRVHGELLAEFEVRVAKHRVVRLMRLQGLVGVHRRKDAAAGANSTNGTMTTSKAPSHVTRPTAFGSPT